MGQENLGGAAGDRDGGTDTGPAARTHQQVDPSGEAGSAELDRRASGSDTGRAAGPFGRASDGDGGTDTAPAARTHQQVAPSGEAGSAELDRRASGSDTGRAAGPFISAAADSSGIDAVVDGAESHGGRSE